MSTFAKLQNSLRAFEDQAFKRLISTRWLGQFADGFFQTSLATFILFSPERQPSAKSAALAFTVVLLPYSLVGPFLGTLLDRFSRQRIVEFSNYSRFVLVVLVGFLLKAHSSSILLTTLVLAVFGFGRLILAALSAGLPVIVEKKNLISLNAVAVTFGTLAQIIGIGVAAAGKSLLDLKLPSDSSDALIALGAAVLYLLAALTSRKLGARGIGPNLKIDEQKNISQFKELILGFQLIRKYGEVGRGISVTAINRGAQTALVMMALLLERNTFNAPNHPDLGLRSLGVVLGVAGFGIGIGALISPLVVIKLGRHRWIRLATFCSAPFFILVALFPKHFILLIVAFFVGGFGQGVKVTNDALIQAHIIDDFRGRVFAFYDVAVNGALVVGSMVAAWLLPTSGKSQVMPLVFVVILLWSSFILLRKKYFSPTPPTTSTKDR